MEKIQNLLRSKMATGHISLKDALIVGAHADALLKKSAEILKELRPSFGLFVGGEIDTLIAEITSVRSKDLVYYHEKESSGQ